jgi:hypothetical protein
MKLRILIVAACLAWGQAEAREVGRIEGPNGKVILFDDAYKCPDGSKVIAWIGRDGTVPGCWFERHGFVWAWFADGDKGAFSKEEFKWLDI